MKIEITQNEAMKLAISLHISEKQDVAAAIDEIKAENYKMAMYYLREADAFAELAKTVEKAGGVDLKENESERKEDEESIQARK